MGERETAEGCRTTCRWRAPAQSPNSRGQEGSILLLVITIVLVLSIAVVGVLNYSLNSKVVAVKLEESTQSVHLVDGALEDGVNRVRTDQNVCDDSTQLLGSYEVQCTEVGRDAGPPVVRTMKLTVFRPSSSDIVGRAQIQVTDGINGREIVGQTLEVCDWLLGQSLTEQMEGCHA